MGTAFTHTGNIVLILFKWVSFPSGFSLQDDRPKFRANSRLYYACYMPHVSEFETAVKNYK
jgi:hypothetical protein